MKLIKKLAIGVALVTSVAVVAGTGCFAPVEDLKGVTDTTIYVGNTAATTGAGAVIGEPFNLGIEAAFAVYNENGGYKGLDEAGNQLEAGLKVELAHYDDELSPEKAVTLMEKLIHEDEIFAVVGNYGAYAVNANLDIIKEAGVPMVYAAAGNDELLNENATGEDRAIFPVQPLNKTEGRMLLARAFAPETAEDGVTPLGGLGAKKVGVISSTEESSVALTAGIKAEAENLPEAQKNSIVYQTVTTTDYTSAPAALIEAGCDTVIITVIGSAFTDTLVAMANANYACKVLTSYNNASAAVFNDPTTTVMSNQYIDVFNKIAIYAQGWLDISSLTYVYDEEAKGETPLAAAYKALYESLGLPYAGVAAFNEAYWEVAENIFNYATSKGRTDALTMSSNSYALAGYIAGDMFCQGLAALEKSGESLSRDNFIDIMEETEEFRVAMADTISFQNGMRVGVSTFSLTQMYNSKTLGITSYDTAASATVHGLTSLEDYRALIGG